MADKVFKNKMKSCIGSSKITKLKNKRPIEEVYSDVFDTAVDEFPNVLKKQNNAKSIETRIPDLNITNKKKYKKGKSKRTDVSDSIINTGSLHETFMFKSLETEPLMPILLSASMISSDLSQFEFVNEDAPVKPYVPITANKYSKQVNNKNELKQTILPSSTTTAPKKNWMLWSDKLKPGILARRPKFCPFCEFVCERKIDVHILSKHSDLLKVPKLDSCLAISNIILSSTKKGKTFIPLHRIVYVMGENWSDPEVRDIGYFLCTIGQVVAYGGSWELDHATDIPNPFEQYIENPKNNYN